MILELREGIHKMILEHHRVPESKKIINEKPTKMGICQRETGDNLKSPQWSKLKQFEQLNKVESDYNPKYKINTQESTRI